MVPLLARVYPNGSADVNEFQAAGGPSFVLRELLAGSGIAASHTDCDRVQDPYSFRCQPQVMGAALDLIRSAIPVHGLAHITGGGLLNLLRLNEAAGFEITDPLPVPPIIDLVRERGEVSDAEAWEVFNMGCGFVCVVPEDRAGDAVARLAVRHPGTARIGTVTDAGGTVTVVPHGLRY